MWLLGFKRLQEIVQGVYGGFPKIRGTIFGGPYKKDYSILGSTLGSPYLGKLPNGLQQHESLGIFKGASSFGSYLETAQDFSRLAVNGRQEMVVGRVFGGNVLQGSLRTRGPAMQRPPISRFATPHGLS